jgi:hypothetical protein
MQPNPYETPKTIETKAEPRRRILFFLLVLPLAMVASAIAGVGTCTATVSAVSFVFENSSDYGLILVTLTLLGGAAGGVGALAVYSALANFLSPSHRFQNSRSRFLNSFLFLPLHCVLAISAGLAVSRSGWPEASFPIAGAVGFLSLIITWHLTPKA